MTRTALQLMVSARSHTGRVRATNQDAFGYSAEAHCFAVCDGMGGTAGGEVASRITVETFLERLVPDSAGNGVARRIEQAVTAANRILYTRAQREPSLHGMGTTFVALVLGEGRVWVAHVGDSRCYLFRAGMLARCTEDHSLVEEQVRLGQMTEADAAASPLRHVITRAVGVRKTVAVELHELSTEPGDLFLLCSDGLTRELPEARIQQVLAGFHLASKAAQDPLISGDPAEALLQAALEAGGGDNITCLTVQLPDAKPIRERPASPSQGTHRRHLGTARAAKNTPANPVF